MNISTIMLSLIILLKEPNIESPANPKAAKLFEENIENYKEIVREKTIESWKYTNFI